MIQTVEAVIHADGHARLLGEVYMTDHRRALVTVLEETAVPGVAAPPAELVLAVHRSRPEEDAVWSHRQSETSACSRSRNPRQGTP